MIIYNPNNEEILKERIEQAEHILSQIPVKHCFITGSFLYKRKYNDIDVFVISRSKKKIKVNIEKVKITVLDFNDLYSLFYHSISKSCVSKDFLPKRTLKVTISDYWDIINEAVPTLLNQKNKFHKDVRYLILYTEFFKGGKILDTFQLDEKIKKFVNYKEILRYVENNIPKIINKKIKKSYLKRFFYTQSGFYKDMRNYKAQNFLYDLTHQITRAVANG
jgi:hypothetical protein